MESFVLIYRKLLFARFPSNATRPKSDFNCSILAQTHTHTRGQKMRMDSNVVLHPYKKPKTQIHPLHNVAVNQYHSDSFCPAAQYPNNRLSHSTKQCWRTASRQSHFSFRNLSFFLHFIARFMNNPATLNAFHGSDVGHVVANKSLICIAHSDINWWIENGEGTSKPPPTPFHPLQCLSASQLSASFYQMHSLFGCNLSLGKVVHFKRKISTRNDIGSPTKHTHSHRQNIMHF